MPRRYNPGGMGPIAHRLPLVAQKRRNAARRRFFPVYTYTRFTTLPSMALMGSSAIALRELQVDLAAHIPYRYEQHGVWRVLFAHGSIR